MRRLRPILIVLGGFREAPIGGARQGGQIHDFIHAQAFGKHQGIGEREPALGVSVGHLDSLAIGGSQHVTRMYACGRDHVFADCGDEVTLDTSGPQEAQGLGRPENCAQSTHVVLHVL